MLVCENIFQYYVFQNAELKGLWEIVTIAFPQKCQYQFDNQ